MPCILITMKYIALLRGIGPGDPRMQNDKLRGVFTSLGLHDVTSVIASGNIIFNADSAAGLEQKLEKALFAKLGFHSAVIIRSQTDIKRIIDAQPFGERQHSTKSSYLLVTFFKTPINTTQLILPYQHPTEAYQLLSYSKKGKELYSLTNPAAVKTPNVMAFIEKQWGKGMTSRSWASVNRIYTRMCEE